MGIFNSAIFNNAVFNVGSSTVFGRSGLGGDDVPRRRSPDRGWDKEAYAKRKLDEDALVDTLKGAYASITGEDATISVLSRAAHIVQSETRNDPDAPLIIDWKAMARDQDRAVALMRLYQEEWALRREIEDEDDILMLLN